MLIFCTPVTFMCDAVIADLALGVSHAVFFIKIPQSNCLPAVPP